MSKRKKDSQIGYGTYFIGWLFVMFLGLMILQGLSSTYQPWFVLGGSFICIGIALYRTKASHKTIIELQKRTLWIGCAGLILAILLWTILAPDTSLATWGKILTVGFGMIFLLSTYTIVFERYYPNASVEPYKRR